MNQQGNYNYGGQQMQQYPQQNYMGMHHAQYTDPNMQQMAMDQMYMNQYGGSQQSLHSQQSGYSQHSGYSHQSGYSQQLQYSPQQQSPQMYAQPNPVNAFQNGPFQGSTHSLNTPPLGPQNPMISRPNRYQSVEDKNAAFLARMKAKQAQRRKQSRASSLDDSDDSDNEEKPKINLFGDDALAKASIHKRKEKKRKAKVVVLPNGGLSEQHLFSKYKIMGDERIGQGAFARIKVIRDKMDGRQYALKMVKKKGKSAADIEAFKKEILFLSKLTNHPNIIKMYDFCDSPQGLYMVLEYCNGGDVQQQLKEQKVFREQETKHIAKQIVAGLCYFHSLNIVHRDLKPDNLMYRDGVLKIIDFGLAGECTNNALNTPCGTLHYTAPEVLSSYNYTTKADMWSLGILIHVLICGFPPFLEKSGNQQKLMQLIKKGKFQFEKAFFKKYDQSVMDLITQCLTKSPGQRIDAKKARLHQWFTGIKVGLPIVKGPGTEDADISNNGSGSGGGKGGRLTVDLSGVSRNGGKRHKGKESTMQQPEGNGYRQPPPIQESKSGGGTPGISTRNQYGGPQMNNGQSFGGQNCINYGQNGVKMNQNQYGGQQYGQQQQQQQQSMDMNQQSLGQHNASSFGAQMADQTMMMMMNMMQIGNGSNTNLNGNHNHINQQQFGQQNHNHMNMNMNGNASHQMNQYLHQQQPQNFMMQQMQHPGNGSFRMQYNQYGNQTPSPGHSPEPGSSSSKW